MESLATLAVSLAFIIGLNLLVSLLVWSEYLDHRIRFLKYVALGQMFVTAWHLASAGLVYAEGFRPALAVSLCTFSLALYYFLAAATYRQVPEENSIHRLAAGIGATTLLLGLLSPVLENLLWIFSALVLVATPVVTLVYFRQISRRLIALFQFVNAGLFLSSAVFFETGYPVAGGLFYVLLGLFQPILSVIFIISSIRLNRRDIVARERDYRVFFESVNEVFFRISGNGVIREISPSVAQFGYPASELIGKNLADYLADRDEFLGRLHTPFHGQKPIDYKGAFLSPGNPLDCEIICSRIEDPESGSIYFAGSIRNTHERNQLERQFIEAQRHESMGMLAGGMAHDFNNHLQGIIGYTEILLEARELDAEMKSKGLNTILKASTTAGELCKQLLQYTGKGIQSSDVFNLAEEIRDVLAMLESTCPDNVQLQASLPESPAWIQGDRSQVGQIVLNVVKNALDAVADGGRIGISLSSCYLDESAIRGAGLPLNMVPGNYYRLEFRDSGPGIDPGIVDRIFDPFFSTKLKGHGLGLSAVKGILKIHHGGITCNALPQGGAVFLVYLPALPGGQVAVPASKRDSLASHGMLVLLVEDDGVVRDVAGRMLEHAGYKVLEARDGIDALRVMGLSKQTVDLVVTDVKMPNMDGIELAHNLSQQLPNLPIVLISGYADVAHTLLRAQSLTFQFVAKPFRGDELIFAVEKAAEQVRLRDNSALPDALAARSL